jgi:hypothetical protein
MVESALEEAATLLWLPQPVKIETLRINRTIAGLAFFIKITLSFKRMHVFYYVLSKLHLLFLLLFEERNNLANLLLYK